MEDVALSFSLFQYLNVIHTLWAWNCPRFWEDRDKQGMDSKLQSKKYKLGHRLKWGMLRERERHLKQKGSVEQRGYGVKQKEASASFSSHK